MLANRQLNSLTTDRFGHSRRSRRQELPRAAPPLSHLLPSRVAKGCGTGFNPGVDFDFSSRDQQLKQIPQLGVLVGGRRLPVRFHRNARARRYILRLHPGGYARVTIPRSGSRTEAAGFVAANVPWLERQLTHLAARPQRNAEWRIGKEILFRGEFVRLELVDLGGAPVVRFADCQLPVDSCDADLRPQVERLLWELAVRELPTRVVELAARHGSTVFKVSVRNQRSRWGSCSRHGTISLNWRLIQTPSLVRDYIICHELAHLRHMNHSARFWSEVARLCPEFPAAERWLKQHSGLLR